MTTEPNPRIKITYATLRNDNEELHKLYERGLENARLLLDGHHLNLVGGAWRVGDGEFEKRSPINGQIVGRFARGTRRDVQDAIVSARTAFPGWARTPWQTRIAILRHAADLITERQMELAGLLSIEVGKNRLEALGDVEETADLIRWSCDMLEQNQGFDRPMGNLGDETVHTRSVLKPHGVWAVISPFNFPMALSGGPSGAALAAGNTVVYKPSSEAPLSGVKLAETFDEAGIPDGVFNMVMGPGDSVGAELQENEGVDGITFTGSFEVGFNLFRNFSRRWPRPAIIEMGGKNPAIVSRTADLEEAAEGVMRAAFGFGGQKCSATSRVYVERPVLEPFLDLLVAKTEAITIGDPTLRQNWLGPVIDRRAVERYEAAVAEARHDGRVIIGGELVTERGLGMGFFVAPTVATELPVDHRLFRDELFLPFTVVAAVDSLNEALRLANDTEYGLTAGFYGEDPAEIDQFLDGIEAGVVYVNRRAGATTGAWPGIQPFGGWKGSTATGKSAGGFHYVQQFMREQSQTVVD